MTRRTGRIRRLCRAAHLRATRAITTHAARTVFLIIVFPATVATTGAAVTTTYPTVANHPVTDQGVRIIHITGDQP